MKPAPADMVPYLATRWAVLQPRFAVEHLGYTVRLTETYRDLVAQRAAYAAGHSRADGVRVYSWHNYSPALACDVAVLDVAGTYQTAFRHYEPLGPIARDVGLVWGGDWPKLRDGPHLEVSARERALMLQRALKAGGWDPGAIDGQLGPKTGQAIRLAQTALKLPASGVFDPPTWCALVARVGVVALGS